MQHIVHKNCTEAQFIKSKAVLQEIEKRLSSFAPGFQAVGQERPGSADILAISILKKENKETLDMGILYDDNAGTETFTFYVAKSIRKESDLYFRREDIVSAISLIEMEKGLEANCRLALQKLKGWELKDLSKM
jgi:hypothetical protein